MNFPLANLQLIAGMLGDALTEPLDRDAQRSLSDEQLIAALKITEDIGRWTDAARLGLGGEVGRRSEPGAAEVSLTTTYGCDTPIDLLERAIHVSNATARARLRTARAITPRVTLPRFRCRRHSLGTSDATARSIASLSARTAR